MPHSSWSGSICHVADAVKRRSAPHCGGSGSVARVGQKSADDLEIEARIRAHLRQQMKERGITQTELARRIGADDGNIKRILSGERGIKSLGQVKRICSALKLTPTRLFEEDPPKKFWDESQKAED